MWASCKRSSKGYTKDELKENKLIVAKELVAAGANVNQEAEVIIRFVVLIILCAISLKL